MTTQEVKDLFNYDNGFLYWKTTGSGRKLNQPIGCKNSRGYWQCKVKNKQWKVHRLIWLWHGNTLDDNMQIDHINRNPSDNRIENLRLVTPAQNRQNNSGRFVSLKKKGRWQWWEAYTPRTKNFAVKSLGCFKTKEEAETAVKFFLTTSTIDGDAKVGYTWFDTH
jgi:hypothetical protein